MENDDIIEQPFDEEGYMDFEYAVEDDEEEQRRFDRWSARQQRTSDTIVPTPTKGKKDGRLKTVCHH
jgi:hypothetical protein